ncbi:MAG TPA: short-chain dehydrogenase [Syntrophobacteraceae bacterium]|nr:short-chain dehydrogenase [Syntrophobacteraceae bacterium]
MVLLVLGGNSDVGFAIARRFAEAEGAYVILASRQVDQLARKAKDLEIRYQIHAKAVYFDACHHESHAEFYRSLEPRPDGVVLAFGYLGDQLEAQRDFSEARRIVDTNFLGAVSILEIVAAEFETRGRGFIIGISSVAGERGRQSNYVYGSAKAALTAYLSGLRNRLWASNVRVMTVLPGFVRTKMTANLKLPQRLLAEPLDVANEIYHAYRKGKDIVYSKRLWRWVMAVIRMLPEPLFKRLRL